LEDAAEVGDGGGVIGGGRCAEVEGGAEEVRWKGGHVVLEDEYVFISE